MKAIVYTKYGPPDVLQLMEVDKPEPKDNQVLIKVQAASANALDYRRFESISLMGRLMEKLVLKSAGKVLGADIAGRVEAVGTSITQYQPGDEVFGISAGSVGGFAEYVCAPEKSLARKPANRSFEEAAAVPVAGLTALQGLRDRGKLQPGQKVLVNGASGGVGTFTVQIAKSFGAEVTAVCSPRNLEIARAIGADYVIDYSKEDFTRNGQRYDLIIAANGYHPILNYRRASYPGGIYMALGGTIPQILQAMLMGPLISKIGDMQMGFLGLANVNQPDLAYLGELLEAGKIAPVIEQSYPLSDVAEAMRYLAQGHAQGKVVITVEPDI